MDELTYTDIKTTVRELLDLNLECYKEKQMHRRLEAWLARAGASDWHQYLAQLRNEPEELIRFRNYLTINVSSFFRDSERWETLKTEILPKLLQDPHVSAQEGLRIWSAGCSVGAEPYSLAFLLEELAPFKQHYILATDYDRGALKIGQDRGPYTEENLKSLSPEMIREIFESPDPPWYVKKRLARWVHFKEHNLFTDPTETHFDLIVCRNVVIYFNAEVKDALFRKFHHALRDGGYLFLGGTEYIMRPQDFGLSHISTCFYRKGEK